MMATGINHDIDNEEGGERGSKVLPEEEYATSQPITSGGTKIILKHEDLWTCRHCGWTYPNAHPSAKHRRNHKKHCGKPKGERRGHSKSSSDVSTEASSDDEGQVTSHHGNGKHKLQDLKDIPSERNNHSTDKQVGDSQSKQMDFQLTPSKGSQKVQNISLPVRADDEIRGIKMIEHGVSAENMPDKDGSHLQVGLQESIVPIERENKKQNDLDNFKEPVLGSECETSGISFQPDEIIKEHNSRKPTNKEQLVSECSAMAQNDISLVTGHPINCEARESRLKEAVVSPDLKSMSAELHPEEVQRSVVPQNLLLEKHAALDIYPDIMNEVASNKNSCSQPPHNHYNGDLSGTGLKEPLHEENRALALAAETAPVSDRKQGDDIAAVSDEKQGYDLSDQGLQKEGEIVGKGTQTKEAMEIREIVSEDSGTSLRPRGTKSAELVDDGPDDTTQADTGWKVKDNRAEENSLVVDLLADATVLQLERAPQTIITDSRVNRDVTKQHMVDMNGNVFEGVNSYRQEYPKSSALEVHTPQLWEQLLDAEVEKNRPSEVDGSMLPLFLSPNAISGNTLESGFADDLRTVNAPSSQFVQGDKSNSLLTQSSDAPSSLNVGSQFVDASDRRSIDQAKPAETMAARMAPMPETVLSQTADGTSVPPDGEKTKADFLVDGSSIKMGTENLVEADGDCKPHTSLEVLLSEDPDSTGVQGKPQEITSSADRSSPSSKGFPSVRKALGRARSSPPKLLSENLKPGIDKPKAKPKWGIFVCCSAVN